MVKRIVLTACLLTLAMSVSAFAQSSFQNTCSEIEFAYVNNQPTLKATCLTAAGAANATSLVLTGISNQNGTLVQGSGKSSFQQSCGNIQIVVESTSKVVLTAFCRTTSGSSKSTSLPLNGIGNSNGKLVQN